MKLSRPLDFLVVADHSDQMGFFPILPLASRTPCGSHGTQVVRHDEFRKRGGSRDGYDSSSHREISPRSSIPATSLPYRNTWQDNIAAAEQFNEPGKFTALIGYEWTSNAGNNLHRNVF